MLKVGALFGIPNKQGRHIAGPIFLTTTATLFLGHGGCLGVQVHNYPHCWRSDTPLIYRAFWLSQEMAGQMAGLWGVRGSLHFSLFGTSQKWRSLQRKLTKWINFSSGEIRWPPLRLWPLGFRITLCDPLGDVRLLGREAYFPYLRQTQKRRLNVSQTYPKQTQTAQPTQPPPHPHKGGLVGGGSTAWNIYEILV